MNDAPLKVKDYKMTIVCIDGIIGCGKTTLIRSLKEKYTCFEEPIEKWTLLSSLYNDMDKFAEPFQFQVLFTQFEQSCVLKTLNKVIIERCPETSLHVFTNLLKDNNYFTIEAFNLYKKFYNTMGFKPDYYIWLDIDVYDAWERIKNRDRFEEQNITLEYLNELKTGYERFFKDKNNVFKVNALQPSAKVKMDTLNIINKLF